MRRIAGLSLGVAFWLLPLASSGEPLDVRMIPAEGEGAKYWPRWRGPTGQGLAGPGNYPDKWSDTENVLWKVPVPGAGNSSPIVWSGRIFLTTSYDKGKRRSILCLERSKGKKLWESFVPAIVPVENVKDKNGWASGTPTTDGERVYAYFGNHGLYCCDFDGNKVWHETFGEMDAYHGMSCSPLLYKDRVIIFQDHRSASGSFVAAFDKKTGKELWKTPRTEKVGWGSPIAVSVNGKDQIIVSSEFRVYAYDPADGKVLWSCAGNLVEVTPTPVAGHGLLFCCSGRVGPTLAIRPGQGDVSKTNVAWRTIKGAPFIPSPLLDGDYIYMVNDIVSVITCFEAKTGKLQWQERCGQELKHGFSASPVGVNGKVFFTNDDGETFVLAAGPQFKHLHTNNLSEKTLASPALVDGKWYIRTERHLYCIGFKD
ncbi:MAG: PQQ-like beta-propeller repeat protein [Gemmataceae bacterium]|nr:PQQ-like beta-propeller repeat protein [Gemmataceae bacterium]MCI0738412.1 PQQ-like beta-propeller repeat protein [Gemmataceae bacterium]